MCNVTRAIACNTRDKDGCTDILTQGENGIFQTIYLSYKIFFKNKFRSQCNNADFSFKSSFFESKARDIKCTEILVANNENFIIFKICLTFSCLQMGNVW